MRAKVLTATTLAAAMLLSGCGRPDEDAGDAAIDYRPPTVISRLDFGGVIERRFHRYDLNGDDKLTAEELPERLQPVLARRDKNGDGALDSDEWGAMMLGRFDAQDLNKDGSLTSDERRAWRQAQRRDGATP